MNLPEPMIEVLGTWRTGGPSYRCRWTGERWEAWCALPEFERYGWRETYGAPIRWVALEPKGDK